MSEAPANTIRRDIASAYAVTFCRIAAWVVISALVYRWYRPRYYGILSLVRSTLGILTYTTAGIAPAMIHYLSHAKPVQPIPVDTLAESNVTLDYARPSIGKPQVTYEQNVYAAGSQVTIGLALVAAAGTMIYAYALANPYHFSHDASNVIFNFTITFGLGTILRVLSDVPSALLQTRGRLALDNLVLCLAELTWVGLTVLLFRRYVETLEPIGIAYVIANGFLYASRTLLAHDPKFSVFSNWASWATVSKLLSFGVLVVIAQAADFLYAPTDNILINHFLGLDQVANYAPAIQVDAGLLLLVGAIATVLIPRAAIASAAGNVKQLRTYYIRGTFASLVILIFAAVGALAIAPRLFHAWLGDTMPVTCAILPLVLIHTVVGGSAVGRSVLLGMGRVKAYTTAVLVAAITNVVFSCLFVGYFGLGLRGIIYGTLIAVIARCAIWMPWYVLRTLKRAEQNPGAAALISSQDPLPTDSLPTNG